MIRERRLEGRYKVAFHERIEERIAELLVSRRRRGPLRGADGVRRARARQPLDPGQPLRPPRGGADQPDDQEPRLLDAVRADGARASGRGDYLVNPKGLASPYMMLAMPTHPEARDAHHGGRPSHRTAPRGRRSSSATWNPEYHAVIREFERRTGVGAVLNTSFNLHGEPIVCSRRATRWTRSSARACRTSPSATGSSPRSRTGSLSEKPG